MKIKCGFQFQFLCMFRNSLRTAKSRWCKRSTKKLVGSSFLPKLTRISNESLSCWI
jgi:hypothetical protein